MSTTGATWKCLHCEHFNPASRLSCEVCDARGSFSFRAGARSGALLLLDSIAVLAVYAASLLILGVENILAGTARVRFVPARARRTAIAAREQFLRRRLKRADASIAAIESELAGVERWTAQAE